MADRSRNGSAGNRGVYKVFVMQIEIPEPKSIEGFLACIIVLEILWIYAWLQ